VPSLNVGRAQTADPFGAVGYLGVSVELPLFDTRRGPLAKAESEARAATLKSELTESETAAQLLRYAQIIRTRQSALTRYEEDTAARLPTLQQMAEDAYRLGRGTVFDLVDATRTRHELQQNRIDLLAALIDAQLHWLALTGELERLHPSTPTTPP
jgi:cobalt-zinc-cadmium efflux system outer membrane protein